MGNSYPLMMVEILLTMILIDWVDYSIIDSYNNYILYIFRYVL